MSRKFVLAPVLKIRRVQERASAAKAAEAAARAGLALSVAELRAGRAKESAFRESAIGLAFIASQIASRVRAVDAVMARQAWAEATVEEGELRQDWSAAAQRVKALEHLEENHTLAVKHEDDHAEALQVDDMVTARYAKTSAPPSTRARDSERDRRSSVADRNDPAAVRHGDKPDRRRRADDPDRGERVLRPDPGLSPAEHQR
jgi:hypothetical protein